MLDESCDTISTAANSVADGDSSAKKGNGISIAPFT